MSTGGACPFWAGILALVQQYQNSQPSLLYALASASVAPGGLVCPGSTSGTRRT